MLNRTKLVFGVTIAVAVAFSLMTGSVSKLLAINSPSPKNALEENRAGGEKKKHSKKAEHHGESHHVHSHHLAIFSGATNNIDAEHTDFTLGAEYEYRLPIWQNRLGIGVIGERVFADQPENILAGAALLHVGKGLKFLAAPGVVFAKHESHGETETVKEFLFRTGVAKDFHVGRFSVTPALNFDFIKGHVSVVYGLTFGKGF